MHHVDICRTHHGIGLMPWSSSVPGFASWRVNVSRCEVSLEDQVKSQKPFKAEFRCVVMTHKVTGWTKGPPHNPQRNRKVRLDVFFHTYWLPVGSFSVVSDEGTSSLLFWQGKSQWRALSGGKLAVKDYNLSCVNLTDIMLIVDTKFFGMQNI